MTDYEKAKAAGLTSLDRWSNGMPHHPMSIRIVEFLMQHDFNDYDDHFCWKFGGDGDNGESLAFQMDAFFESLDKNKTETDKTVEKLREALSLALQYVPLDGEDSCKIYELVKATTDELSEAILGPDSEFITYSHIRAPKGPRFRQYRKTKLPAWATDVQPSN